MVNLSDSVLDRTFSALADSTRRRMLTRLAQGEVSVGELARPFRMSLPAVSKHLRVLERAGLVRQTRIGRVRRCRLAARPLRGATEWMEAYRQFWEGQLDSLEEFLASTSEQEKSS